MRNRDRNFLHNHLGLGEDTPRGLPITTCYRIAPMRPTTCGAYFAWKLGLPFGRHDCRAKSLQGPLVCTDWATNDTWTASPTRVPMRLRRPPARSA